jgi:hypothetical protein
LRRSRQLLRFGKKIVNGAPAVESTIHQIGWWMHADNGPSPRFKAFLHKFSNLDYQDSFIPVSVTILSGTGCARRDWITSSDGPSEKLKDSPLTDLTFPCNNQESRKTLSTRLIHTASCFMLRSTHYLDKAWKQQNYIPSF